MKFNKIFVTGALIASISLSGCYKIEGDLESKPKIIEGVVKEEFGTLLNDTSGVAYGLVIENRDGEYTFEVRGDSFAHPSMKSLGLLAKVIEPGKRIRINCWGTEASKEQSFGVTYSDRIALIEKSKK